MDNPQEELQKEMNTPELSPHKNWLFRHMLLGYVFLGLVFGGAILAVYYLKYGGQKGTDDQVCIQMIQRARNPQTGEERDFPTPCDVPEGWEKITEIDETVNWQSYRNDEYGFEFKYPTDWNYKNENDGLCFREIGKVYIVEESEVCGVYFNVSQVNPHRLAIDELINRRKIENPKLEVINLKIDDKIDATRIKDYGDETYFDYQGNAYVFSDQGNLENTSDVISQILSTFKFIE